MTAPLKVGLLGAGVYWLAQALHLPPLPAAALAVAATLAVTSVPEDIAGPSLTSFDFNPKSISVGSGPKPVVCTMGVADSPAGVDTATCTLQFFDIVGFDFVIQSQSCTATTPFTGRWDR